MVEGRAKRAATEGRENEGIRDKTEGYEGRRKERGREERDMRPKG